MTLKSLVGAVILTFWGVMAVQAQSFHLGLEAGGDAAYFENSDASQIQGSHYGLAGGAFAEFGLGDFAIQPEVLYIRKGAQTLDATSTFVVDYIEVPVLLKYYFGLPVINPAIFIGPYVAFNTLAQAQNGIITNPSSTDWGGVAGAEIHLGALSLSGRWELGISHVTTDTNIQNRDFLVLLGYSFI